MILFIAFEPSEAAQAAGVAAALGEPFDLLLLTGAPDGPTGATKEIVLNLPEVPPADALAADLASRSGYGYVIATSSMASKDVLPRLAGLWDAPIVTDVVEVLTPTTFKRPIFAGSILATVEVSGSPILFTFRPAGFPASAPLSAGVRSEGAYSGSGSAKRVSASQKKGGRPDLAVAKRVVSGGKPLKDAETFERVIGGLADKLGAAVGATRAAVDSGIAANELQVGQTGKVVAPDLYIAAGISGSTQHVAGIKDSKVIVAINKDADAPIFEVADLGLVADLFDALPELESKL